MEQPPEHSAGGGAHGSGTRHTREHGAGHTTMTAQYSAAGAPVLASGETTKRNALKEGAREAMEAAGVTVPAGSVGDQREHRLATEVLVCRGSGPSRERQLPPPPL